MDAAEGTPNHSHVTQSRVSRCGKGTIMTDAVTATTIPTQSQLAPLPPDARPWQRRASTQVLGALGLVLSMAAVSFWTYAAQGDGASLRLMFLGPLVGGGALIFWILFLHLVVCGDGLDVLGFGRDRPGLDALLGVGLAAGLLAFHFAFAATAARLFPPRPQVPGVLELVSGVVRNPWLLALWLGPVVWIGVALFEELGRAFLLRRIWQAWPGASGRWAGIMIVSALVGLVHAYQGSAAVVMIGIESLLLGWIYLRTGRIRALIVCHALYDSVQIVLAVVTIRQLGL
jgi:membrane protease YdiL (CAAX protease family)